MASTCLLYSTVIIDALNDRNGRGRLLEGLLAELDFFAAALRNIGAPNPKSGARSDGGSTKRSKP